MTEELIGIIARFVAGVVCGVVVGYIILLCIKKNSRNLDVANTKISNQNDQIRAIRDMYAKHVETTKGDDLRLLIIEGSVSDLYLKHETHRHNKNKLYYKAAKGGRDAQSKA